MLLNYMKKKKSSAIYWNIFQDNRTILWSLYSRDTVFSFRKLKISKPKIPQDKKLCSLTLQNDCRICFFFMYEMYCSRVFFSAIMSVCIADHTQSHSECLFSTVTFECIERSIFDRQRMHLSRNVVVYSSEMAFVAHGIFQNILQNG